MANTYGPDHYCHGIRIIEARDEENQRYYAYALCGWVYSVKTLDEAKADIKAHYRADKAYQQNF